jgi:hypothetical protein
MKQNYFILRAITALSFVAVGLCSSTVFGQCTVSAGDDFSTCDTEGVQLTGSYTFIPQVAFDQNQTNTCMATFSQGDLAQSFTATTTASCGAGLYFSEAATGSLTISLWSNLPTLGGVQLATGTSMLSNQTDGNVYWPSVSLTPGTQYFLVFTSTDAPITACVAGSTLDPYAGGMTYANTGYMAYAGFDYTFRVFSCEEPTAPALELDQSQINTCMAFFNQGGIAQSFLATTASSCGAGLYFESPATGNLIISLWTGLPNAGGTQLASGSALLSNAAFGDVSWPQASIIPGNTYYLVFETAGSEITSCIGGSTANPYDGGMLFANAGYAAFPNFDYAFKLFSCESAISIEWTGPNIESGANTANATVNPSVGTNTYTFTMTDASSGCTVSDEVVVTVNEVSNLATTTNGLTITAVNENATYQWVDCDNGNALISGAIAQTFTAVANGNYAVELTENGCVATSDCVAITTVSLNELSQHVIMVMPNPNKGVFTLKADVTGLSYNLMDSQGRLISSGVTTENQTTFSIENEANGVYFLRVENEVLKLIKH